MSSVNPKHKYVKRYRLKKRILHTMENIRKRLKRRGIKSYVLVNDDGIASLYIPLSSIVNAVKEHISLDLRRYIAIKQIIIKKENKLTPAVLLFFDFEGKAMEIEKTVEVIDLDRESETESSQESNR